MSLMSKWAKEWAREGGPGIILPREVVDYGQEGWLRYRKLKSPRVSPGPSVRVEGFENHDPWALSARSEWERAAGALFDDRAAGGVVFTLDAGLSPEEAQLACESARQIHVRAGSSRGLIYGTFRLIRAIQCGEVSPGWSCRHVPAISTRVWMHFDNVFPKVTSSAAMAEKRCGSGHCCRRTPGAATPNMPGCWLRSESMASSSTTSMPESPSLAAGG